MKKLLLIVVLLFSFAGLSFAAVNINTATQEQLESLKGIGPAKAKAIIDYRKKNGPFKSVGELENVPGIGPGILKQIRNDVAVNGPSAVQKEDKPAAKEAKKQEKVAVKEEKKAENKDGKKAEKK